MRERGSLAWTGTTAALVCVALGLRQVFGLALGVPVFQGQDAIKRMASASGA